jgi:hypothetical protein
MRVLVTPYDCVLVYMPFSCAGVPRKVEPTPGSVLWKDTGEMTRPLAAQRRGVSRV